MKTNQQGIPAAAFMATFSSAGRDWENEQREERRYQRELHADASDYVEANSVEAPEFQPKKSAGNWTTQMNLFDEVA